MEQFPGFFEKAKNISEAHSKEKMCKDDTTLASESVQNKRWDICETCSHNFGGRCQVCGCGLGHLIKQSSSMCPIMKWSHS